MDVSILIRFEAMWNAIKEYTHTVRAVGCSNGIYWSLYCLSRLEIYVRSHIINFEMK